LFVLHCTVPREADAWSGSMLKAGEKHPDNDPPIRESDGCDRRQREYLVLSNRLEC
jgi:hypothetical protein